MTSVTGSFSPPPTTSTPDEHRPGPFPPDWDALAPLVAESADRDRVAALLAEVSPRAAVLARTDAPLVVLQREFGRLHRRAYRPDDT